METLDKARSKRLYWLGVILIIIGIIALIPLYFYEIPSANKDILAMGIGVVLGWGSASVTYYFGNSEK